MKVLIIFILIGLTLAEPPSYRQQFQNKDRTYYFAKQQESEASEAADAPYAASGWRPNGPAFEYPQKQQQPSPQQQYGAPSLPQNQYGAPATAPERQYGGPATAPERQYGGPATAPERQYGGPATAPERQYGTPATAPERQYETPASAPEREYGVPASAPERQYGSPAASQEQFGARQRQDQASQKQYEAPQQQYGAPQQQYGTPQHSAESTTAFNYEEQTTFASATESQAEPVDSVNELDDEGNFDEQQKQSGQYFIALPDGRLQRVQYISKQNLEAMKYFAKIRAENVEPLRGPIYAYQPLQKLQFAPTQLEAVAEPVIPISSYGVRESSARNQKNPATPAKLEVQPMAAEVIPPLASFPGYSANYQTPSAEQRFLISF